MSRTSRLLFSIITILLFLVLGTKCVCQIVFQKQAKIVFNLADTDIKKVHDGYVALSASNSGGAGAEDVSLVKLNLNGDVLWSKNYGGTSREYASSFRVNTDSGFILVGTTMSFGSGGMDVYLVRTDLNGNLLWSKTYGGANEDIGVGVEQTDDGGFIIIGKTTNFTCCEDVYIIKTDANGDSLWTGIYNHHYWGSPICIKKTSDNGFLISESSSGGSGYSASALFKIDQNGNTLWTRRFSNSSSGFYSNIIYDIEETIDSAYIVVGSITIPSLSKVVLWLAKISSNGDTLWTKTFSTAASNFYGRCVRRLKDGNYLVGSRASYSNPSSLLVPSLIKIDPNGNIIWTKKLYYQTNLLCINSIELEEDGSLFLDGSDLSGYTQVLMKTNENGNFSCDTNITNTPTLISYSLNVYGTNTIAPRIQAGGSIISPPTVSSNGSSITTYCYSEIIPIVYPKVHINSASITTGDQLSITGLNFISNGMAKLRITGPSGHFTDISVQTTNSGEFIYTFSTDSTMNLGTYFLHATDSISNLTTVIKSFTLTKANHINYLSITDPLTSFSIDVNDGIILEFKDKMVLVQSYPVNGSNRLYSYFVELSSDGGVNWQPVTTLTGQALINQWILKQFFYSISNPGSNYKFKITDTYNPSNFVTTPAFVVNSVTVTNNLKVQLQWDFSYPQTSSPVNGVCADGTARIYLDLSKINTGLGVPISSVSVTLDDGGVNNGYTKLGKVKVATNTNSYSSEANGVTTITATNNTPGLSNYYFWYVAPDDFVGNNVSDESGSERLVSATFTVTFADASVEVIAKNIKIVRPPLMLVHGLGGDPSTWDNFRENLFGNTLNFSNNYKFKTVIPVSIDPASNFANNAFGITGDGTTNSMPGVISEMRLNGYASVKVDYIGHSMGGSVLRYALDHYYNRFTRTGSSSRLQYKNYEAGYINKVITLGTPHNGSPIADIINRYVSDIPFWARLTLHNWYGLSEKPFPFYYIRPVNPNAFVWEYEPTEAVMDLRTNGGVRFNSSVVKAHLIAGDIFPGNQINLPAGLIPQDIIDQVHDVGDNTLEHFINYLFQAAKINETDPILQQAVQDVVSNVGPVSDALSFLEKLSLAMDALNYTTFIPESDLIVSVSSQWAGYSQTVPNVSKFDNFIGHSWPFPKRETNNLQIGNQVMQLLNEPIISDKFDAFPDNSTVQRRVHHQLQPLATNTYYSIRDTTILKLALPIDSSNIYIDSTMTVSIELIDTIGLKTLNVYFQNKTYPIHNLRPGHFSINLQVNSNAIDWCKMVVEGYYNFTDSAKLVYDERTLNVTSNDTLIGFKANPDLIQLAINQISFSDYEAQYMHFNTPVGNFDQSLLLTIYDTNIVSFDASTHGFKGKNHGQTFAVASYHGFGDTIYFDVRGCVGSTVNISSVTTSICQGDTLQLTADSGTQFEWSTGDTTQTISVTTGGEYSIITIDGNSCIASTSVDINVYPLPSISTSVTNVNCFGNTNGTAAATVSGTSPYTYTWSPSGGTSAIASNLSAGNYTLTVTDSAGCIGTSTVIITQPPSVTALTGTLTNVNCNGGTTGSATVIPGGGIGGYTYLWTPSGGTGIVASNLAAGVYTVLVSDDNGCTATTTATITQPAAFVITASTTSATCGQADGSAFINVSGGTGQYTYSWNTTPTQTTQSVTGLTAGVYTCTIIDNIGCSTTSTVIVGNTTTLNATSSQTNILCNGDNTGTATLSHTGGTGPYTFLWTPSGQITATILGLVSGTYIGSVSDSSGCVASVVVAITEPDPLNANATSIDSVNCNGGNDGSATIITTGGTIPYSYSWSNGATNQTATNLSGTNYGCTVTDTNGCTASLNVTVGEPAQLLTTETKIDATCGTCCDGQATVVPTGGTPGYSYLWSNGGTSPTANALCPDTFEIVITDANFCTDTISVIISYPVGIKEMLSTNKFIVFPNPTHGTFTVEINTGNNERILLKVFDSIGQMVFDKDIYVNQNLKYEVDLSNRAKGMYWIQLVGNKYMYSQKLIME